MEAYIIIDGKRTELTQKQLEALGISPTRGLFKRADSKTLYYHITPRGTIYELFDGDSTGDRERYAVANYCTDKNLMQQRAYTETLNRLLWRYSMEHGGSEIDWSNRDDAYRIGYDYVARRWEPYLSRDVRTFGTPYFATMEIAYNAIVKIIEPFMAEHPDFQIV